MRKIFQTSVLFIFISHAAFSQTLQQLYDIADEQSRQIIVSKTSLRAATEAVAEARSAILPDVTLSAAGNYTGDATLMSRGFSTSGTTEVILPGLGPQQVSNGRQPTPHWGNTFLAQVSQVIYAGGGITAGIRMAELSEQTARLDVEKQRQEVRFLITGYYLDLYKLQNQLKVIDYNIVLTEKVIENMKARRDQGTVLKNDVTRYELQLKTLQLARDKVLDGASIINHQLATMLHLREGVTITPDTTEMSRLFAAISCQHEEKVWQQSANDNNLDIRQAAVTTQITEQRVKSVKASSLPSVVVVAGDNLTGPYTTDLIPVDANVNVWFVGVGVKYDLGNLWKNKHAIRKARFEQQQSQEQLLLKREHVENAVQANYTNFLTSFKEVETQEKQVQMADENYEVVQKRYQNDLALLTDMLDAGNTKLSADMALVNARITLLYHYYKLRYVTHTL